MRLGFRVLVGLCALLIIAFLSVEVVSNGTQAAADPGLAVASRPLFQGAPLVPLRKVAELYDPRILNAAQGIRAYGPSADQQGSRLAVASGYLNGADLYDLELRPVWLKPYRKAEGDLTLFADVVRLKDGRYAYTDFKGDRIVVIDAKGVDDAQWGVGVLHLPIGIDQFDDGAIVVADYGNDLLRLFSPEGKLIRTVANPGELGVQQPYDVRVHKNSLYLVDRQRHRILKFDRALKLVRLFETAPDGTFLFNHPQHIDFDSHGRLYVMDTRSNSVKVIETETGVVVATLTHPDLYADRGIAIDHQDRIYVAGFRKAALSDDAKLAEDEAGIMVFAPVAFQNRPSEK